MYEFTPRISLYLLLNVDVALGTSIAAGSGSSHTQGENNKLKYKNNILLFDFVNII